MWSERQKILMFTSLLIVGCTVTNNLYGQESVPSWLDTVPPRVHIEPQQRIHQSLFHVTLSSDEQAQLWFAQQKRRKMQRYKQPISVTREGIYRFYFYGEDDFGNKSPLDSITYVFDAQPPKLVLDPPPGTYRKNRIIRLQSNEACDYFFTPQKTDSLHSAISDSLVLETTIEGFIVAVDKAGNRTWSEKIRYMVDTSQLVLKVRPPKGIYNVPQMVKITAPKGTDVFYTLDPLAPPEWFERFTDPVRLPHGLTIVRYFAKSSSGATSSINKISYILDTIPPKLHVKIGKGSSVDTVYLICKEKAVIRFTADGSIPNNRSEQYTMPLVVPHKGISRIKAKAWDRAGNMSGILSWEYKYDHTPPVVSVSPPGGTYNKPVSITFSSNEPTRYLYSINGSSVDDAALVYTPGELSITRQGVTELRYRGIDAAENSSEEAIEQYIIDSRPPEIKALIQSDIAANTFYINLLCNEPVTIYYTVNGGNPNENSQRYTVPFTLKNGDVVRYYGIDSVGNTTSFVILDDLDKPMIEAQPSAGLYNKRLRINFEKTVNGTVWWRLLPDTVFRSLLDTIMLDKEGMHTFEYFLQTEEGIQSTIRRNEYFLDWSPPQVAIRVQKGEGDSAVIFFDATENASIYFTIDGSNPLFSATTRTAGNKFQRANDRISLQRIPETRLAYYAEDAAGNQSALTILDVFSPRVVPNVPAGVDRIHDRILSIVLQTQEGGIIHFLRHGMTPTMQSPVFREPLTLASSDTIVAFVVDPSGYRGEAESFIYLIDLPPSPQFTTAPDTIFSTTTVTFDASGSFDRESDFKRLLFRWDFDGDTTFDTDSAYLPKVSHSFSSPGEYTVVLQIIDERKRSAVFRKKIQVRERCPIGMVPAFDSKGNAFCIDRYEWPNKKGEPPLTNVSWVEAKMYCIDAGKRLCRIDEWISTCSNNAASMYPYGDRYDPQRCATEEKTAVASGSHDRCVSAGVSDMIGNTWEWVEEKSNDYVRALGGSFRYGKDAHCKLQYDGTVATRSEETGFRCCK